MEKAGQPNKPVYTGNTFNKKLRIAAAASLLTLALFWNLPSFTRVSQSINGGNSPQVSNINFDSWCPISEATTTVEDGLDSPSKFLEQGSILKQVERMAAAVKIPTESFDDNDDVDVDPRWAVFEDLHATLKDLFPLVFVPSRYRQL